MKESEMTAGFEWLGKTERGKRTENTERAESTATKERVKMERTEKD